MAVINCATSIYAGFVVFASLGFMAVTKNVTMENVAKAGKTVDSIQHFWRDSRRVWFGIIRMSSVNKL